MYVCMYVCMYVHIYVYMYMYVRHVKSSSRSSGASVALGDSVLWERSVLGRETSIRQRLTPSPCCCRNAGRRPRCGRRRLAAAAKWKPAYANGLAETGRDPEESANEKLTSPCPPKHQECCSRHRMLTMRVLLAWLPNVADGAACADDGARLITSRLFSLCLVITLSSLELIS